MKFNNSALSAFAVLTLVGCGCGGNTQQSTDLNTPTQPGGAGRAPTDKVGHHVLVGVVFDKGGRGDKSFNDSAFNGTELAKKDLTVDIKTADSPHEKDYETNLAGMADAGCDLVFAIGNDQDKAIAAVAPKYPNVKFAIVDAVVAQPNVRSIIFSEEQGSFLAGYLAGLTSKSGKIGFVGGMEIPLIKKFECGYDAGATTANPKIEILPAKYTDSWDDIDKGKAAADVLFNSGADIVYHAAGRCGIGVIRSAKEHSKFAIGVDSDQDDVAKGSVLTSMIKHVDQAVYQTIKDVATDRFTPGTKVYDLKSGGVGLSDMKFTKGAMPKDATAKVNKMSEAIKTGTLNHLLGIVPHVDVPTTPEALKAYVDALTAAAASKPVSK